MGAEPNGERIQNAGRVRWRRDAVHVLQCRAVDTDGGEVGGCDVVGGPEVRVEQMAEVLGDGGPVRCGDHCR